MFTVQTLNVFSIFHLDCSFVLRCKDVDVSAYLPLYSFCTALKRQVK